MISYAPLRKTLAEKNLNLTYLRENFGISSATTAKIKKDEYMSLEMIDKICSGLGCKIEEVVEIRKES